MRLQGADPFSVRGGWGLGARVWEKNQGAIARSSATEAGGGKRSTFQKRC